MQKINLFEYLNNNVPYPLHYNLNMNFEVLFSTDLGI